MFNFFQIEKYLFIQACKFATTLKFGNHCSTQRIMNPDEYKRLGRKFTQNEYHLEYLLNTGKKILARDRYCEIAKLLM